jgi:hypothetical protein
MNEHIRRGNQALGKGEMGAARAEFILALSAPDELTQRIARNRLREIAAAIGSEPLRIGDWTELVPPVTKSRCCDGRAMFVRSRDGGFVAKNCTLCKKSGYAYESDFPVVNCCGKQWRVAIIEKNYHYRCGDCGRTIMLADCLPIWSDLFPYDPLVAPGDPGWDSWR